MKCFRENINHGMLYCIELWRFSRYGILINFLNDINNPIR